jgi:hypothetical protein
VFISHSTHHFSFSFAAAIIVLKGKTSRGILPKSKNASVEKQPEVLYNQRDKLQSSILHLYAREGMKADSISVREELPGCVDIRLESGDR